MPKKDEKAIPMKCAFDKDRECNATCVAFYVIQAGGSATWGCKRLR